MDYGKLAYINLNDVNKRLQNLEKSNKSVFRAYTHTKTLNQSIQDYYSYELRFGAGEGELSLIGKLKFFHKNTSRADITIKINDLVCYFDTYVFLEGAQEYLIFTSAQTQSGNNILKIEIGGQEYQGELISLDLYLLGDNLKGFEPDSCLRLLNRQSKKLAAFLAGDKFACFVSDTDIFDFDASPYILGEGIGFWLCQGYDNPLKTAIAYIDAQKNLKFKTLESYPIHIDEDVLSAAVMPVDIGYVIAYIKNSKAYYKFVYWGIQVSSRFEIKMPAGLLETISAINDAPRPMLLIKTSDQKIYLKTSYPNIFFEEGISEINLTSIPI
ncbi:MAG TPA: hypothetical protein GX745_00670 [Clostridiales bacterium]|nr:hypothetical protein [Clostridiales bacterium]